MLDPPVTVKLMSICQSVSEAISGKLYVDNVGIVIAPVVAYTVLVVAVPLLNVIPGVSTAYVNVPRLFELGSLNVNEPSVVE